jgi:hypothetical protein
MTTTKPDVSLALMTPPKALMELVPAGMAFGQRLIEAQAALARDLQDYGQHWLERRQEALRTGVAAAANMATPDLLQSLRAGRDWYAGSVERMTADAQESLDLMARCGKAVTTSGGGKAKTKPVASIRAA